MLAWTRPHGIPIDDDYPVVCDRCGRERMRSECQYEALYGDLGESKNLFCLESCWDIPEPQYPYPSVGELAPVGDPRPPFDLPQVAVLPPVLTLLTPSTRTQDDFHFDQHIGLTGTFRPDSQIYVGGQKTVTLYVSASSLIATISRDTYGTRGTYGVLVANVREPFTESGPGVSATLHLMVT